MNKVEPKTLSGFMELLPNEQVLFNQMMDKIRMSYEKFGFLPLDTPLIESSEVLLAKAGGETEKQLYTFTKGDNNLTLRFDLTVPLAKYVAEYYNEITFPFRRYQIGKVYRGERAQRRKISWVLSMWYRYHRWWKFKYNKWCRNTCNYVRNF